MELFKPTGCRLDPFKASNVGLLASLQPSLVLCYFRGLLFVRISFKRLFSPKNLLPDKKSTFRTVCTTHSSYGQTRACSESSKPYVPRYQAIKSVCSVDKRCVVVKEAHTPTVQLGGVKLISSRFCFGQLSCQLRLHGLCTRRAPRSRQ